MARALYQAIIISFIAWKVCTSFWSMYVCMYIYIYINNKKTSLAVCVCCP
jgi:hypothetical protein